MTVAQIADAMRAAPGAGGAAVLTAQVQLCRSPEEVGELFVAFSHTANAINVTAMLCRLSKVATAAAFAPPSSAGTRARANRAADLAALVFELRGVAEELLPSCRPRELATLAAALARLGAADRRTLQLLLPRCPLRALRPCELAQLAWAVARSELMPDPAWVEELGAASAVQLRRAAAASERRGAGEGCAVDEESVAAEWGWAADEATVAAHGGGGGGDLLPRETAVIAWATATLHRRGILMGAGAGAPRRARVDAGWREALRGAALAGLCEFGPADLSVTLWALAALGDAPPGPWLAAAAGRAMALAPVMQERHVASTLWAFSRMQRAADERAHADGGGDAGAQRSGLPPAEAAALCGALQRRMSRLLPALRRPVLNASVALSSLARMRARPEPAFVDALLRPMQAVLEAAVRAAPPLPASAAEAAAAAEAACDQAAAGTSGNGSSGGGGGDGGGLAAAAEARVRAHAARAAARELSRPGGWRPRDLATVAWALARLGYRPPAPWLAAARAAAARWLHVFRGRELSLLAHSLAALDPEGSRGVLAGAVRVTLMHPGHVSALDVALLLHALARCGGAHRPAPAQVARLLQLHLSRADDAAPAGGAAALALAAASLPAVARPAQLRRLPAGARHASGEELLARLAGASQVRLADCDAALLTRFACAFAWLGWSPGREWLEAFGRRAAEVAAARGCGAAEEEELRAAAGALLAVHRRAEARGDARPDVAAAAQPLERPIPDRRAPVEVAVLV